MPFDAEAEPERSLQVELAENEKRVNYSRDQIERLRSLNYRDIPGCPKEIEKALSPALPESKQPIRAEQSLYKAIPTSLQKVKANLEQESKKK